MRSDGGRQRGSGIGWFVGLGSGGPRPMGVGGIRGEFVG